jgi:purine-binding chemotaxis protein CheW
MCRVGDRSLAVPLDCVIETMRPLPLRAFAGVPRFVLGVAVIRGAVVPVLDVGAVLGVPGVRPARFVTIRLDERVVALAVDAVLDVRTLAEARLQDVPPLLGGLDQAALSAIGTLDSGLLLVLGQAHLLPDLVWAELEAEAARNDPGLAPGSPGSPDLLGSAGSADAPGSIEPVTSS